MSRGLGDVYKRQPTSGPAPSPTRRASIFSRAPIVHDMTIAFTIWGFLGGAPPELVEHRRPIFEAVSHHYWEQRAIADGIPEETLRLPHATVVERFPARWRELLGR